MPEFRRLGSARAFRRPTLRAKMAMLYGAVICASGVVLLAVTLLLDPGSTRRQVAPGEPGLGAARSGHTRIPSIGSSAFWSIVAALAFVAVFSLVVGWLIAGRFVRPLRAIITTARDISASNLHRRLGVRGSGDEFTELGETLDDLFGRLEASFTAQRQFIANASHELRTPLSAERALLQVALSDPDATVETLRATCQELVELGDQQERLIAALLALARSQRGVGQLERLDLAAITRDVLLARHDEAECHGIRLHAALDAAPATGDPSLAESLIANLLDNAIVHNLRGGQAEISTALTAEGAVVSVSNTGTLIPPEAVQDLFQPFRQLGTERTSRGQGYGLGLAIVRAIADAHSATITARARPAGGLDIEVTFPDIRRPDGAARTPRAPGSALTRRAAPSRSERPLSHSQGARSRALIVCSPMTWIRRSRSASGLDGSAV